MTRDKPFDETLDRALLDADEALLDDDAEVDAITVVAEGLSTVTPPAGLLARVLESARTEPRFARFAADVARLLDITLEQANGMLSRLADTQVWEPSFLPGVELCHVKGGPRVANAITGFVRIREHVTFPEHEHLGEESILVLQGRCLDNGRIYGPGDQFSMEAGSTEHTFTVCPGPDFLQLAVVQKGLRIGDMTLYPDDPRA